MIHTADHRRPRRRAFTLLEVLIAVAVIVILVGIVFISFRSIDASSRRKSTRVTLENLRSMLTEFETATRLGRRPATWVWRDDPLIDPTASAYDQMALDFWKVQRRRTNDPDAEEVPLDAPDRVEVDAPFTRNASRAVLNTSLVMQQLSSIPANRSMMQSLPAERMFTPAWAAGTNAIPVPGTDDYLGTSGDDTDDVYYPAGVRVKYDDRYFRCLISHNSPGGTSPPASPNWREEPDQAPMPLDAWNNPIIFVPGSGLAVIVNVGTNDSAIDGDEVTRVVQSPDRRPFFASAGPDGNFWKADDNLYSFEN